ncbi:uncharacterized protein LOC115024664 isoform X2 [Cottoperca gobio]|uniref:Uncharacterized protein LOC115024664 isoform X2 n=1 Tax=Cottoperca gobio TaxID=56716 RepID=A0A6J2RQJ7_COTGO|nr:uncharacterized protein LOC115024664 isoform X2 [Cottoperca gobio]
MGDVWLLVCVLTVCLAEGSCLSIRDVNERSGEGLQRTSRELSPNDISLKKAFALLQSMESMFEQEVGHLKRKPLSRKDFKTERKNYDPHRNLSNHKVPYASKKETSSDYVVPYALLNEVPYVFVPYALANEKSSDVVPWANETSSDVVPWANETSSDVVPWDNETSSNVVDYALLNEVPYVFVPYDLANETSSDMVPWANATASDHDVHYTSKNETSSDHYASKNETSSDHYASKNETSSDHYASKNETSSDVAT